MSIAEKIEAAGAPTLHVDNVVRKAPEGSDALKCAHAWLRDKERPTFLVLSGGMGTHKTGAAVWIMADAATRVKHVPVPDFMRFVAAPELRKAFGFDESDEKFMHKLKRVPLLVIDDLGTEYADKSGWFNQGLNDLVNERYANKRYTVVTTNLSPTDFIATYPRIADRMREAGKFVTIGGTSKRGK